MQFAPREGIAAEWSAYVRHPTVLCRGGEGGRSKYSMWYDMARHGSGSYFAEGTSRMKRVVLIGMQNGLKKSRFEKGQPSAVVPGEACSCSRMQDGCVTVVYISHALSLIALWASCGDLRVVGALRGGIMKGR